MVAHSALDSFNIVTFHSECAWYLGWRREHGY